MSLKYIKDFTVKTKAVYRCSCGATVIADKAKVESGERTGCRICDKFLDLNTKGSCTKVKKEGEEVRDYHVGKFYKGAQFGSLTLTGKFYRTYSSHRMYEAECICGKIAFYGTNVLSNQNDGCRHHRLKPRLKVGGMLGIYNVVEATDKRYHKRVVYKFECTECGTVRECSIAELYNPNKCSCNKSVRKYTPIEIGKTYGVYTVIEKTSTRKEGDTTYMVQCNVCGIRKIKRSFAINLNITRCMHKTEADYERATFE